MDDRLIKWRNRIIRFLRRGLYIGRRLPPGIRSLVGFLLIIGGTVGLLLPIPGLWIILLGVAFVAMEFPVLRRRQIRWLQRIRLHYRHSRS